MPQGQVKSDDYVDNAGTAAAPATLGFAPAAAPSPPVANILYKESIVHGWAHYNQSSPAIGDSYNLDSITDSSTGNFILNWTTDFASVSYAVVGSTDQASGTTPYIVCPHTMTVGTTSCGVHLGANGAVSDRDPISIMAIGGQ